MINADLYEILLLAPGKQFPVYLEEAILLVDEKNKDRFACTIGNVWMK